jgi:putative ABC transport system permease protein
VRLHPGMALAGEWPLLGGIVLAGLLAGLLPAWRATRTALSDGLTPRL